MRPYSIPEPDPDLIVWRYITFDKFLDLINTKTIYLPRLDQFNDLHEGYIPMPNPVSPPFWDVASQRHAWAWRFITFASCWHSFEEENSLMWSPYGGGDGVVIRSTAQKLADIASSMPNSYIAEVIYGPWPNPIPSGGHMELPLRKRLEFKAESELRIVVENIDLAIIDDFPQLGSNPPLHWPTYMRAPFDGLPLIDEIRLLPGALPDFNRKVADALSAAGIVAPVLSSSLDPQPIWFDPKA